MKHILIILMLLPVLCTGQVLSPILSGGHYNTQFGGGGQRITLPGCSTQTEVIDVYRITYSGGTTADTIYSNIGLNCLQSGFCGSFSYIFNSISTSQSLYNSMFIDLDSDGSYETETTGGSVLMITTSRSGFFPGWQGTPSKNVRIIMSTQPINNSCPSVISGHIQDFSYSTYCD